MRSMVLAFSFLSRFWMPRIETRPATFAGALAWFPVVGIALGLVGAGVLWVSNAWLGPWVASALTVACLAWLSGGLHLDGLADTIDGFSAGRGKRERILEVMSDSRIGAHGAVGLVLLLQLKWALLVRVMDLHFGVGYVGAALVTALAVSRGLAAVLVVVCPTAKSHGLATLFQVPGAGWYAGLSVLGCVAIGMFTYLFLPIATRAHTFWGFGLGCMVTVVSAAWVVRRLGGLTGDTVGAVIELSEVAVLLGWGLA